MISIDIYVGQIVAIDNDPHTVTNISDVLDSDMGLGEIVRRRTIALRSYNTGIVRRVTIQDPE